MAKDGQTDVSCIPKVHIHKAQLFEDFFKILKFEFDIHNI